MPSIDRGIFAAFLLSLGSLHSAEIASVFSDHMVLQQGMEVPVWGKGKPGETVLVTFGGQQLTTAADARGKWMVKLAPLQASSEPRTLACRSDAGDKTINDVLVGEVWLASGQSNMVFKLHQANGSPEAKAPDPMIRFLTVPRTPRPAPVDSVFAKWQVASDSEVNMFSAVGFYFAKQLAAQRKVPVGIVCSAVGATPAKAWTPREVMESHPQLRHLTDELADKVSRFDGPAEEKNFREAKRIYDEEMARISGDPKARRPKKPVFPIAPDRDQNSPATLYNGMISPLVPMAFRGVIWYQGESDGKAAELYRVMFPAMIGSWRDLFGKNLPFLFVQVAPFKDMPQEIRDAQLFAWRTVPNTAMAVITDFGEERNIHPVEKLPVAERLALAARALAYGENIEYSGPLVDTLKVEGGKAVLTFTHTGGGLVAKGGGLKGFTVSGDGQNFVPAEAKIDGATVIVGNPAVAQPKEVRFGWANMPDGNLFNAEGLPASPFRIEVK